MHDATPLLVVIGVWQKPPARKINPGVPIEIKHSPLSRRQLDFLFFHIISEQCYYVDWLPDLPSSRSSQERKADDSDDIPRSVLAVDDPLTSIPHRQSIRTEY